MYMVLYLERVLRTLGPKTLNSRGEWERVANYQKRVETNRSPSWSVFLCIVYLDYMGIMEKKMKLLYYNRVYIGVRESAYPRFSGGVGGMGHFGVLCAEVSSTMGP